MPVYGFKFHQCDGTVSNVDVGVQARDLADARRAAIESARGIMADEIRHGRLCLSCWIVVSDEQGNHVMTLQFGDAIAMVGQADCNHETEEQAWTTH